MKFMSVIAVLAVLSGACTANTLKVPGQYGTIQDALDAVSAGDTILIADGTYGGTGNVDLTISTGIMLMSESNDPEACIIDCDSTCRALTISAHEVMVQGMTFANGFHASSGGAIYCSGRAPLFYNCIFRGNEARHGGSIAFTTVMTVGIGWCIFHDNSSFEGAGIYLEFVDNCTVTNCTFDNNRCESEYDYGAAIACADMSSAIVEYSIISNSSLGPAISTTAGGSAVLLCSNLYNNAGGDWVGSISQQEGIDGNLSLDPQYCGIPGSYNYYLQSDSPCVADKDPNSAACGLIGALSVGCGPVQTGSGFLGQNKNEIQIRIARFDCPGSHHHAL